MSSPGGDKAMEVGSSAASTNGRLPTALSFERGPPLGQTPSFKAFGANEGSGGLGKHTANNPLRRLGAVVDRFLLNTFAFIGRYCAIHPWRVILVMAAICIALGAGIARIKVDTASEKLYTPQGSQAFADRDYRDMYYAYDPVQMQVYETGPNNDGSNILNKPALLQLLMLHEELLSVEGVEKGVAYRLEDERVCDRPAGPGTPCNIVGVLDFWNYSSAAIQADDDLGRTVSNLSATDRLGRPIPRGQVMGGIMYGADNSTIIGAAAFQTIYSLKNNKSSPSGDKSDKVTDAWQEAAVPVVRNFPAQSVSVWVFSPWQEDHEAGKTITADITLLIIGYVLLLAYGIIVLSRPHAVWSNHLLAYANIASIALAVIATYGLVILCGVHFSLVVQVLALLLLGLGTDDMLVTMAAYDETGREMPLATRAERVSTTVSRARRGIIVASLTNFVAFCTGIESTLPALRDFMIFAAVGIIMVLILQSTFFPACIALNLRRQEVGRSSLLCCRKSKAGPTDGCFGRTYQPNGLSIPQRIIGGFLPRIILHPLGKVAVLAVSVFLLVMGIVGAVQVKQDFNFEWFIPKNNYVSDVYRVRDPYFQGRGIPFSVYTKNLATPPLDYFNYQDELAALSANLQADKYVTHAPPVRSWYTDYITWLSDSKHAGSLSSAGRPTTSADFSLWLKEYLNSTAGQRYQDHVVFSGSTIVTSQIDASTVSLSDSTQQVNAMKSVRKTAKDSAPDLDAIAYADAFLFFEGFAVISWQTIKGIIIAGSVVFVILLVMLGDLISSILVGLMVILVDVELVGFLHWAGLAFNSVTSINLLIAIGVAIDYSAFVAFSFMSRTGTLQQRAEKCLAHFGVAVFNGGFTLFLAVLPAAGASSYIFQTFFKMFAMIVVLGLFHALCTLPVLFSLIGSEAYESAYTREAACTREAELSQSKVASTPSPIANPNPTPLDAPRQQAMA